MTNSSRLRSFFTWLLMLCLVSFSVPVAAVQAAVISTNIASTSQLAFLVKDSSPNLSLQYVKLAYLDKSVPYGQSHYKVLTPTDVTAQHTNNGLLVSVPTVDWKLSNTYVALVVTNKQVFEVQVAANAQQPVSLNPALGYTLYADPPTRGVHGTFHQQEIRLELEKLDDGYVAEHLFSIPVQSGMKIVLKADVTSYSYEWLGYDDDHVYFLRPRLAIGSARDGSNSGVYFQNDDYLTDLQVDMKNTDLQLTSIQSRTVSTDAPNNPTRIDLTNFPSLQGIYVTEQTSYPDLDFTFTDANQNTVEYGPSKLPYPNDVWTNNKATISFDTSWNAQLSKKRAVYHPSFTMHSAYDLGLVVTDSYGNQILKMSDAQGEEMKGTLNFASASDSVSVPVTPVGSYLQLPDTADTYTVTYANPAQFSYPLQSASLDLQLVPYPLDYGVNTVYEIDQFISGYGEPGMAVGVYQDGVLWYTAKIQDSGKFWLERPLRAKAGTILTVRFSDPAHGFMDTVLFSVHELSPYVNDVGDKDLYVTGMAPAGSTVTVSNSSKVIGKAVTSANYMFKVPIPKQQGGTTLAVTVSNGKTTVGQATLYVIVKDTTPPKTPVILGRITDNRTLVQGTAEPGATITIKNDDLVVGSGWTDADGNFQLGLDFVQTLGDKLTITATDGANNTSVPLTYIVKDGTPPDAPTILNPVIDTDHYVSGKAEPNALITVKNYFDGFYTKIYGTGRADKNGNFKVSVRSLVGEEAVGVTATDTSGNVSQQQYALVKDTTPPPAPKLKPFRSTDTVLTVIGEYGTDVYVTCEGHTYSGMIYDSSGVTTMIIGQHARGALIEAYVVDRADLESRTTTIRVQ